MKKVTFSEIFFSQLTLSLPKACKFTHAQFGPFLMRFMAIHWILGRLSATGSCSNWIEQWRTKEKRKIIRLGFDVPLMNNRHCRLRGGGGGGGRKKAQRSLW